MDRAVVAPAAAAAVVAVGDKNALVENPCSSCAHTAIRSFCSLLSVLFVCWFGCFVS